MVGIRCVSFDPSRDLPFYESRRKNHAFDDKEKGSAYVTNTYFFIILRLGCLYYTTILFFIPLRIHSLRLYLVLVSPHLTNCS